MPPVYPTPPRLYNLAQRSVDVILAFDRLLWEQMARSYHWDLWAAVYVTNGGCSDDGFDYFRGWLIAQGEAVFEPALRDPDTLIDAVTADDDYVECEAMLGVGYGAYKAVTGQELPIGDPVYRPREPGGAPWDEEEVAARAPLLAIKRGSPLNGVRVVVTGRLQRYTRASITELLEALGASVGTSVSWKTTFLLVGQEPGSKLARAQALGIKTLSEEEFLRLLPPII